MLGAHLQSFGSSQLFSPGTVCVRVGHVCVRERKGEVPERQDKGNNNGAPIQGQLCTGESSECPAPADAWLAGTLGPRGRR